MRPRTILIDGSNVIRNTPALQRAERRGLESGRDALVRLVTARYARTSDSVIVVFDGKGMTETAHPLRCGVRSRVIYTRAGETADAAIVRLSEEATAAGRDPTVATDDRALREAAARHGAASAPVREMARALNAPPRHLEHRARHHAVVRRLLEKDDEHENTHPRKGNPRRTPKPRRRRPRGPGW